MSRKLGHLTRSEVAGFSALALLLFAVFALHEWLSPLSPRVGLAMFVLGYPFVVALAGFLAWTAWSLVFMSYRLRYDPSSRSPMARIRALLREPWFLAFACLLTVGTVGAVTHLVREILRRVS